MKLKDAKEVKVTITYEIEIPKEDIDEDATPDDIIRRAEEECISGSGYHEYTIEGSDGTSWCSIDDD